MSTRVPCLAAPALVSVRIARMTLPWRPMTLPTSSSATWSSYTRTRPESTSSTWTSSGLSTRFLARKSTSSFTLVAHVLLRFPARRSSGKANHGGVGRGRRGGRDAGVREEAGNAVGRLGSAAQPLLGLVAVDVDGG